MALEHEIEALAARADQHKRTRLQQLLRDFAKRDMILAYRRLFLDDAGEVSADGARVLADLAAVARIGVADLSTVGEAELRERAGRRSLALHIIARLDLGGAQLRALARKIRERTNE